MSIAPYKLQPKPSVYENFPVISATHSEAIFIHKNVLSHVFLVLTLSIFPLSSLAAKRLKILSKVQLRVGERERDDSKKCSVW